MTEMDALTRPDTGIAQVVREGYCVGCGACSISSGGRVRLQLDADGVMRARADDESVLTNPALSATCPFGDAAMNEDRLGDILYPSAAAHPELGRYLDTWAAHVTDGGFRERGSSGGMGSWILERLLALEEVDAVVHVAEAPAPGALFAYRISTTMEQVRAGAKSRYYPITLAEVVQQVKARPGRYAFTGVPCFIKAVRLLAKADPEFAPSVAYCIGLVCGHLKSAGFAEFLAWQMGVPPTALSRFDFRVKMPGRAANRYGASAHGAIGGHVIDAVAPMAQLYGQDWGMGLFKLKACDYCDDVVAETADLTVGDAWLPRYVQDSGGTNLVIVRHERLRALLTQAKDQGLLHIEPLSPEEAVQSQASGFAHRREGLAFRLARADEAGIWRPLKRVQAATGQSKTFIRRHELRIQLARESHAAFLEAKRQGTLKPFFDRVVPLAEAYRDLTRTPWKRIAVRLRRWLKGDPVVRAALRNSTKHKEQAS